MRGIVGMALILLMVGLLGCGAGSSGGAAKEAGPSVVLLDGRAIDLMDTRAPLVDSSDDVEDGVDFDTIRVAVEDGRLLFQVATHSRIGLQNGSGLQLHLDTDPAHDGAELVWLFGEREGTFVTTDGEIEVEHAALGMITAPTVSSLNFEIGLSLDAIVEGTSVFPGDEVGVAFLDSRSGDRIPDEGYHTVALAPVAMAPEVLTVDQLDPTAVRVMAWNVLWDGITERPETFDPIMDVIDPDVVIFSEVWETPAEVAADLMNDWRPLPDGQRWHGAKQGADIIAVSKYTITDSWPIEGARAGAFLLEMPAPFTEPLFVIGMHPPCCGKNDERQLEIDAIMAFVRDARAGVGVAEVPSDVPLLITGDSNLVGYREQLTTFTKGKIKNTDKYGDPAFPDSDDTPLLNLFPRHLQDNVVYTWRQDDSSYGPGKLDYMFVGDADLSVSHSFVFDTRLFDQPLLDELGLTAEASPAASDHLPVIADFLPVE